MSEQLDVREQGDVIEIRQTSEGKFYWRVVDKDGKEIDKLPRKRFDDVERYKATSEASEAEEKAADEFRAASASFREAMLEGQTGKIADARVRLHDAHAAHQQVTAVDLTPTPGARHECEQDALAKHPGLPVVVFGPDKD